MHEPHYALKCRGGWHQKTRPKNRSKLCFLGFFFFRLFIVNHLVDYLLTLNISMHFYDFNNVLKTYFYRYLYLFLWKTRVFFQPGGKGMDVFDMCYSFEELGGVGWHENFQISGAATSSPPPHRKFSMCPGERFTLRFGSGLRFPLWSHLWQKCIRFCNLANFFVLTSFAVYPICPCWTTLQHSDIYVFLHGWLRIRIQGFFSNLYWPSTLGY